MRVALAAALLLSGCFATQRDLDSANARLAEDKKTIESQQRELLRLSQDVAAAQQRLDNALRANADTGSDLWSEKQRLNQMAGRLDELDHGVGDVRHDLVAARGEVDARLDELKRAIDAQANKPAPVVVPADRAAHFAAIESARAQKDLTLARTLGREYVSRYPADDKTDDVLFSLGDLELADNHPAAALAEFAADAARTLYVLDVRDPEEFAALLRELIAERDAGKLQGRRPAPVAASPLRTRRAPDARPGRRGRGRGARAASSPRSPRGTRHAPAGAGRPCRRTRRDRSA